MLADSENDHAFKQFSLNQKKMFIKSTNIREFKKWFQ